MNIGQNQYTKMAEKVAPKSKSMLNTIKAFCIGGLICSLAQLLNSLYSSFGIDEKNSGLLVSVTLIFISALLTGLKLYEKIAKHGGAGTLVPITGFANAVVSPAIEFRSEGFILGVGAKIFVIAGPVILYGTIASVIYGIIYYIIK